MSDKNKKDKSHLFNSETGRAAGKKSRRKGPSMRTLMKQNLDEKGIMTIEIEWYGTKEDFITLGKLTNANFHYKRHTQTGKLTYFLKVPVGNRQAILNAAFKEARKGNTNMIKFLFEQDSGKAPERADDGTIVNETKQVDFTKLPTDVLEKLSGFSLPTMEMLTEENNEYAAKQKKKKKSKKKK